MVRLRVHGEQFVHGVWYAAQDSNAHTLHTHVKAALGAQPHAKMMPHKITVFLLFFLFTGATAPFDPLFYSKHPNIGRKKNCAYP